MSSELTQATVFYSWESDLPGKSTRNLIEGCLNRAIRQLGPEDDLDVDPSLDRDTKGISGSPAIFDSILQKIDNCTAFVADVSIINSGDLICADLEDIQAKLTAWSTCCYIGTAANTIKLDCLLYADNLKQPFKQQLTLNFSIEDQSKTLKEWIAAKFIATKNDTPISVEAEGGS